MYRKLVFNMYRKLRSRGALTSKRGACRKTENVAKKGNWKG